MNSLTSRREFLNKSIKVLSGVALGSILINKSCLDALAINNNYYKRAYFFEKLEGGFIKCKICPNKCTVALGRIGKCKVKKNINGEYYTIVYSRPAVIQMDNIEKAPLYHFDPGNKMLSIATAGCNLTCKYCQNWQFSQSYPNKVKSFDLTPMQVVNKAKQSGCKSISFFYTEPAVYYEYMYDIALIAKRAGLKTIMVTAGYINPEPLRYLCKVIDAFTVGLKGFNNQYYKTIVGGSLEPVRTSIKLLKEHNKHFEIVNLIVPTMNDSEHELKSLVDWILSNLGNDIPLHFARFVPQYQLQKLPSTPVNTLNKAWKIAKNSGIKYTYIDNLPGHEAQNTICPHCKATLVRRVGFTVIDNQLQSSKCNYCGEYIKGVW